MMLYFNISLNIIITAMYLSHIVLAAFEINNKCVRYIIYSRNDLNVHDILSEKLKFSLSTNSSTRT